MSHSPCHHDCDWTDGDADVSDDLGCCSPLPVRITCEAPVLPTPECDAEPATIEYDPDTEQFTALSTLYDTFCSAITDSIGSIITTPIG